jgi:hypothetical protein
MHCTTTTQNVDTTMAKAVLHVATITYTGRDSRPAPYNIVCYCYPKRFVRNGPRRIMAPAPSTAWMSTAFRSTSDTLWYQNRWLSYSKWNELVKEHYFGNGKQDQAEELNFSTTSLVQAINRKWKKSLDDFTACI